MQRTLLTTGIICIILFCHLLLAQQRQEKPATAPAMRPSNTVSAQYAFRVVWPSEAALPDLTSFIVNHPDTQATATKILGGSKLSGLSGLRVHQTANDLWALHVELDLREPGTRAAAAEFADAVLGSLQKQLTNYQNEVASNQIGHHRRAVDEQANRLSQLRSEREEARQNVRRHTGRADGGENWGTAIASLEQERQKLALDNTGMAARRQAIQEAVARITREAESRAEKDEIAAEIQKIVTLRTTELQRARQLSESGRASETMVADIEAKLADARAKLFERREMAARGAGGEILTDLNRELLMLTINVAENEARLKHVGTTLEGFQRSATDVDRLKTVDREIFTQEELHRAARGRLAEIEERYRVRGEVMVTVLDRDTRAAGPAQGQGRRE